MKKQKFRSQYNFKREPEKLDKGSLTVPGESLTIRQLFARHKAGIIDGVKLQGEYDEDDEFIPPDRQVLDHFDLTSIDEAKEFVENKENERIKREKIKKDKETALEEERKSKEKSDEKKAVEIKKESFDDDSKK